MVVELQAVQHPGAVVEAEDVLGEQVAVSVDDPALFDAHVEQRLAAGEVPADQLLDLLHALGRVAVGIECTNLREARLPPGGQCVPRALRVHVRRADRLRVVRGEQSGDGPQVTVDDRALPYEPGQAALRRHTTHHDERFG